MKKDKIQSKFTLISFVFVFVLITLSRLLHILYMITSSDVSFSGSENFFVHSLPYIARYGAAVLYQASYAAAVCGVILSARSFEKKRAVISAAISSAIFLYGNALFFIYNIIRNSLETAQLIAGTMSLLAEVMYSVIILIISLIVSFTYFRKTLRKSSVLIPAIIIFALALVLRFADLTVFNVVPFVIKYDDINSKEISQIVFDYLYYLAFYFAIPSLLSAAASPIASKLNILPPKDADRKEIN